MPDLREQLQEGVRRERAGLPEAALVSYRLVEELSDSPELRAEALWRSSNALRASCQWDEAVAAARRGARLAEEAGLGAQLAEALNAEALVHLSRGDFEAAGPLLRRILDSTADPRLRGIALQNLGSIAAQSEDFDAAERHFAESSACFRAAGYVRGEALALNNYARVSLDRGDVALAAELLRRTVALAREVDDHDLEALAKMNLGDALLRQGDLEGAEEMASAALGFYAAAGDAWRRVESLQLLGDIHLRLRDAETARACYDQGLALARGLGARLEIASLERRLAQLTAEPR